MLEQIERKLDELSTLTPKLEDGALKSFVESRSSEAQQVLDAAMKALQENSSQSQTLQEQLIENISQMADGVEEQRLRQESKQEELMDFIKEVMEKLEAAQNDQEQLANALQAQRSSSGRRTAWFLKKLALQRILSRWPYDTEVGSVWATSPWNTVH